MLDPNQFNEVETWYNVIDPLIIKAEWNLADHQSISFKFPIDGYDTYSFNGITDYRLFRDDVEIPAVIEAKHAHQYAKVAKELHYQYITRVKKKQSFSTFGSLTNGDDIWIWDSMQTVFVQKCRIEVVDLDETPFTNIGLNAVEKLFSKEDVEEILELTKRLIA